MRAVGYFRETRGHSLASQSEEFIRFCTDNGYQAAAAFLDGKSSGDAGGFHQLLEFIKQQVDGGFLIVVVRTAQILGEGPVEAARRYFQLAGFGLPVISIETGDDIGPTLLGDWAEQRAGGSLGDKVRAAMRRRTVKGEALGRPPPGLRRAACGSRRDFCSCGIHTGSSGTAQSAPGRRFGASTSACA